MNRKIVVLVEEAAIAEAVVVTTVMAGETGINIGIFPLKNAYLNIDLG